MEDLFARRESGRGGEGAGRGSQPLSQLSPRLISAVGGREGGENFWKLKTSFGGAG